MRYWNPNTESCYVKEQLNRLSEDIKSSLVEIGDWEWDECLRLNREEGKLIINDPNTNHPTTVDPVPPSEKELLEAERKECLAWFKKEGGSDDLACKCVCEGKVFKDTYPELYAEGVAKRKRINEIEALLAK